LHQHSTAMMRLSTCSFLIGLDLVRSYEPNEIKYTILATDKTHDTLETACQDLGDYAEQNIGPDARDPVVTSCMAGGGAPDPEKETWFGPDWKKATQAQVEREIAANKWFVCSGGEAEACFDGYEQKRYTTKEAVCDELLVGHEADEHRLRIQSVDEARADCLAATQQPGVKFTKKIEKDQHLRPLESFCKMDTLDEICENAWYDDSSEVWKLRTSCQCQPEHTVDCDFGESTQACMTRMFSNLGMDADQFERIELVVAETDSTKPHTKKITSMDDLYTQMQTQLSNKEKKWMREGKLTEADAIE